MFAYARNTYKFNNNTLKGNRMKEPTNLESNKEIHFLDSCLVNKTYSRTQTNCWSDMNVMIIKSGVNGVP